MSTGGSTLTVQQLVVENRAHDRLILGLVLATLMVVSAYPVGLANPDARLYLAAGRLIVRGEYKYGTDPFAYAPHQPQGWTWWQRVLGTLGLGPKQLEWVNAGWLPEVVFYLVYASCGGAGLVILRVMLTLAISVLLWRVAWQTSEQSSKAAGRQRGPATVSDASSGVKAVPRPYSAWLAMGLLATGLVVCMRLHIRPETFGLLFLVCLLVLLVEPPRAVGHDRPTGPVWRRWWWQLLRLGRGRLWCLIPVMFCLWANSDGTVVLGLAVLVLYWLGQHLQAMWGPDRYSRDVLHHEERRLLARVIGASLVAALVNPFHVHVLDPSPLFFPETAAALQSGSGVARLGVSPFSAAYFTDSQGRWVGLSLAEWTYFVVLLAAIVGWWLGRAHWRWHWFLLGLVGFMLSAYLARYTAWFAILALPGMWMNWRIYLTERFGETPSVTRRAILWTQSGRLVAVILLLALILLTLWPQVETGTAAGWVTQRGWGFSMLEDASLKEAAQVAAAWQGNGKLPGKGLHLAWVNAGPYWSYYQPGSVWLDLRLGLFTRQAVDDFLEIVQGLEKVGTPEGTPQRRRWQELLRRYDVSHIIVHVDNTVTRFDTSKRRVQVPLLPLLLGERDDQGHPVWELLDYLDGETFFLAWTGSPHWPSLQAIRFRPWRRWRQSENDESGVATESTRQAGQHTAVGRDIFPWRTLRVYFTGQPAQPPLATSAARWTFGVVHDMRQRLAPLRQQAEGVLLATQLAGWVGSLPSSGILGTAGRMGTVLGEGWPTLPRWPRLAYETDALLWLAWRWARQGVLQAPGHPLAWGICYDVANLLDAHEAQFTEGVRHESRLLARMFLLRQLTRLQPDMANAQLELVRRYLERGCDDLALTHAELFLRLPQRNDSDGLAPQKRLEEYISMSLEQLRNRVGEARGRFEPLLPALQQPITIQRNPGEVLARAREMWQARMAGLALSLLQQMTLSLSPRQPEFAEAVRLLADIYVQTGDAVSLHRLLEQRWAESVFGPERYQVYRALTAGALGDPQTESEYRRQLEERLQEAAGQSFLRGATQIALGGDVGPAGSFFHGLFLQQQALMRSRERLFNLLAIASANLEAGQLAQARAYFDHILQLAPHEPLAALAEHYLRVLPGE